LSLKGQGQVYKCNPWNGELIHVDFVTEAGYNKGKVAIEEDEKVILAVFEQATEEKVLNNGEKAVI
jgi:hypothetical protein